MRTHLATSLASTIRQQLDAYDITGVSVRYCGDSHGCLVLTVEQREVSRLLTTMCQ